MSVGEIICAFMEPKPLGEAFLSQTYRGDVFTDGDFWMADEYTTVWHVAPLTLDRLHLVEARLTDKQWPVYVAGLSKDSDIMRMGAIFGLIHATAEQKITALAAVIREEQK